MENISIKKTNQTPDVKLDSKTGTLSFSGRSLPEDSTQFYAPIIQWIDSYLSSPCKVTNIVFELDYFNTASAKAIFSIIVKFDKLYESNYSVKIEWLYDEDDEDMKELGEEYKDLFKTPILLIAKKDE